MAYFKTESIKGRGSAHNPTSRFSAKGGSAFGGDAPVYARDEEWDDPEESAPGTQFFVDASKTILSKNDSPDLGFDASLNPYRGCEHGCVYCYARPTHEYYGLSAGLDFESKIFVKHDAPELLRKTLNSKRWKPRIVVMSGNTDCYQPAERKFELTRRCLEVFADFLNPVAVITKNALIQRDVDILKRLAEHGAVQVAVSVTTLDPKLTRIMEPRASHPKRRLETIQALSEAGIPVSVNVAPVIPGLTDHEMPAILAAAARHGATGAGFVPVRLPLGVAPLFEKWLGEHFPDRKDKIVHKLQEMHGGKLYDPDFNTRMRGSGELAAQLRILFDAGCKKAGIEDGWSPLSTDSFRRNELQPEFQFA